MAEISVVIAEDEKLIREGIAGSVDWRELHAEVVGLARNGNEALEIIKRKRTDILLTDIRMAAGDGLELIKNALLINPDIRVVILSGYNSFAYAQQAIHLGVKDYLLKPIDINALRTIVEKLINEIHQGREDRKDRDRLESFYQENRQLLINDFFRDVLFGAISGTELEKKQACYDFVKARHYYFPLILYTELKNPVEWADLQDKLKECTASLRHQWGIGIESLFFMPNEILYTDITLVLSLDYRIDNTSQLIAEVKASLEKLLEVSLLAAGVGEMCSRLEDLSFSYSKAKTHALFSLLSGLKARSGHTDTAGDTLTLTVYETTKDLYRILSTGDKRELNSFFSSIQRELDTKAQDPAFKRTLLRNLFVCVLSAGDELGVPIRKFFPDLISLFRCINLNTLPDLLQKIRWACDTISTQQSTRDERNGIDLMDKAKSYILENYADPLISLETVSAHLSLTPAYFSKLYKKAHGVSYIESITSLRLQKALEYLRDSPEMKISAVAAHVGYNSASYFNYIFKKTYNSTPQEYLKKHAAGARNEGQKNREKKI